MLNEVGILSIKYILDERKRICISHRVCLQDLCNSFLDLGQIFLSELRKYAWPAWLPFHHNFMVFAEAPMMKTKSWNTGNPQCCPGLSEDWVKKL